MSQPLVAPPNPPRGSNTNASWTNRPSGRRPSNSNNSHEDTDIDYKLPDDVFNDLKNFLTLSSVDRISELFVFQRKKTDHVAASTLGVNDVLAYLQAGFAVEFTRVIGVSDSPAGLSIRIRGEIPPLVGLSSVVIAGELYRCNYRPDVNSKAFKVVYTGVPDLWDTSVIGKFAAIPRTPVLQAWRNTTSCAGGVLPTDRVTVLYESLPVAFAGKRRISVPGATIGIRWPFNDKCSQCARFGHKVNQCTISPSQASSVTNPMPTLPNPPIHSVATPTTPALRVEPTLVVPQVASANTTVTAVEPRTTAIALAAPPKKAVEMGKDTERKAKNTKKPIPDHVTDSPNKPSLAPTQKVTTGSG